MKASSADVETRRVLEANSAPDYRARLDAELAAIGNSEMWRTAGRAVRSLRPENRGKQ
jgi:ketol-acid reductoisomerase